MGETRQLEPAIAMPDSLQASRAGEQLATPIGALVTRPPLTVAPDATVAETAQAMSEAATSSALVDGDPPGIVTDRDLRRRVLAPGISPDTPVEAVTSRPLKTLPAETPIYGALQWILGESLHHLPVTRDGRVVGILGERDLLRHQARSPLQLLYRIEHLQDPAALAGYARELAATADALFEGGLHAVQIGRVVAAVNDALTARLLAMAERELGPPPCPYSWIVFGSEGRMEQVLLSDQDNALVYALDVPGAPEYFAGLAARVVDGLLQAGFPPCPGGYMATDWCRPLSEWRASFLGWIERPEPQALLQAQIFFDFRAVHGTLDLRPLEDLLRAAGRHARFLHHLARTSLVFSPAVGRFGRLRRRDDAVDLKAGGIAPVVILARTYALAAGQTPRPTLERLAAAAAEGALSGGAAEQLSDGFRFLTRVRLREQLRSVRAGHPPANSVLMDTLSPHERGRLRDVLRGVRRIQESAAMRFGGGG
jgi:CBS domain-containing protein